MHALVGRGGGFDIPTTKLMGAFHVALEALSSGHSSSSTARQREYEHGCTGLASTQMLLLRIQRISDASYLEVCQ